MTPAEGIASIKKLLFGTDVPATPAAPVPAAAPAVPVQLVEVKTTDGKLLSIDTMAVGGSVMIDGVSAPDAEYTIEDGSIITVVGGLITVIVPAATPAPAPGADMAAFKLEFEAFKSQFTAVQTEFTAHKTQFAAVQNELAGNKEAFAKLLSVVELLSNSSITPPAHTPAAFVKADPLAELSNYQKLKKNRGEL